MEHSAETLRTWAEVDLGAVVHNYREAKRLAGKAAVMPVVKANAYGHGDIPVARALAAAGAGRLAVASAEEALGLRRAGILLPILVLGTVPPAVVRELAAAGVAVCCASPECAREYARAMEKAAHIYTLGMHIKVDTGMARLGVAPAALPGLAAQIDDLPGLAVEGVFTHFAISDEAAGDGFTAEQQRQFAACVNSLGARRPGLLAHAANSGGVLRHPDAAWDLVRPGIMLYGYAPAPDADSAADLHPALAWRARVCGVRSLPAGAVLGYGCEWTAPRDCRIATVSVGYADGLHRAGSGRHAMLVRGQRAPGVGRVCMDMTMLDVTDIPGVGEGDVATLIGADGAARLTADDVAAACGTISYEVLCALSPRVPRLYREVP